MVAVAVIVGVAVGDRRGVCDGVAVTVGVGVKKGTTGVVSAQ
jgi:hypothetical protein